MSLIDDIKNDVKKAGTNKGKIMYFREGTKTRIRFLEDMDEGRKFTFHDSYAKGINVPCQEIFGRECHYCGDDELRTREQYCWSVYDYDANEVKIILAPVNNCSPIPALMSMYEAYGTLLDRDYVISVTGKQQNKTFSVVPMDKNKFRNTKAKPLSESKILSILDKAYPDENADNDEIEDDEDEDVKPRNKKPSKQPVKRSKPVEEDESEDDVDGEDYYSMSPKELYKLCKRRNIDCYPKKTEKYYIGLLEEADEADNEWADDEEDNEENDDWD